MKRWLSRIVILLILGAVTTVAVAWGCALRAHYLYYPDYDAPAVADDQYSKRWLNEMPSQFRTRYPGVVQLLLDRVGCYEVELEDQPLGPRAYDPVRGDAVLLEHMTFAYQGWPARALTASSYQQVRVQDSRAKEAIRQTRWSVGSLARIVERNNGHTLLLALRPVWPGFLINTLVYAAVVATFFAPGGVRRALRRRRGRCPKCNYDLRGELHKGCSECGWGRSEDDA